jgi:hypothetical protein
MKVFAASRCYRYPGFVQTELIWSLPNPNLLVPSQFSFHAALGRLVALSFHFKDRRIYGRFVGLMLAE